MKKQNPLAFAFEPIDWAALAERYRERSRWTKKGDKRPREDVERQMASRRANKRRRQKAIWEARHESAPRLRQRSWEGETLALMEPGNWYAATDLAKVLGVPTRVVSAACVRLRNAGFLEKAKNPDRKPHEYRKGLTVPQQAVRDPEWLWRLTDRGEARKAQGTCRVMG